MKYGQFVELKSDHPLINQIQRDRISFGELRYYVNPDELAAIKAANAAFSEAGNETLRIIDYDIIGWALDQDLIRRLMDVTESEEGTSTKSQEGALLWVRGSGFSPSDAGRLSRTFLELVVLARKKGMKWRRKYGCTKAVEKREPFRRKRVSSDLEQLQADKTKIDFFFPSGLIDPIIGKYQDRGEHLNKEEMISLGLVGKKGEITQLGAALVDVIERWWLTELAIVSNMDSDVFKNKLPLISHLYVIGHKRQSITIQELSARFGFDYEGLDNRISRILSYFVEVPLRYDQEQEKLDAIEKRSGLVFCNMEDLVRKLTSGSLWRRFAQVNLHGTPALREEVNLRLIRNDFVDELVSHIKSTPSRISLLVSPEGWGKTGTLLQLAAKLMEKKTPIVLYRGGDIKRPIHEETVVLCDDIDLLSRQSLTQLIHLQENGITIVAAASRERMMIFSEAVSNLENQQLNLNYDKIDIPRLSEKDSVLLIKSWLSDNVTGADIQRILVAASSYAYSPELLAYICLRVKSLGTLRALNSILIEYSLFRFPSAFFRTLRGVAGTKNDLESELAAIVCMHQFNRIRVADVKILARIAKKLANSQTIPRYFSGFLIDSIEEKRAMLALSRPIFALIDACRETDNYSSMLFMLKKIGLLSEFEFHWALHICNIINSLLNRTRDVTDTFISEIMNEREYSSRMKILPYIVRIAETRYPLKKIRERFFSWLTTMSQQQLLENNINQFCLSEAMDILAYHIQKERFPIQSFRRYIFSLFEHLWIEKKIIPTDRMKASYLNLSLALAKRMALSDPIESLNLLDNGIALADNTHHRSTQVRLLVNRSALLRILSPLFCSQSIEDANEALRVAKDDIRTIDSRPFEAIAHNQLAMSHLYCRNPDSAGKHIKKSLEICTDCEIDSDGSLSASPLGIEKSKGYSFYASALLYLAKGRYYRARIDLEKIPQLMSGTGHDDLFHDVMSLRALLFLLEGDLKSADRLVQYMTLFADTNPRWVLSGASISYFYSLYENMNAEEIEKALRLHKEMQPYHEQIEETDSLLKWWKLPIRLKLLRRKKKYNDILNDTSEFIEYLLSNSKPKSILLMESLRTSLSYVLRETGISLMEQKRYKKACQFLLAAGIYWLPFCGPLPDHFQDLLIESMQSAKISEVTLARWTAKIAESEITIESLQSHVDWRESLENSWSILSYLRDAIIH